MTLYGGDNNGERHNLYTTIYLLFNNHLILKNIIHVFNLQFMFKKILPLIVVAFTLGFTAQTQAQSVTVSIGGSSTGAALTFGTPSKTDITCNGAADGTVTAVATGGNGTITYAIALVSAPTVPIASNATGTFTGLAAGTYIVGAATSGSCTATSASVTVLEPTAVTVSVTASTNATCFGTSTGTITAVAVGGTGASNAAAYVYTITGGNTQAHQRVHLQAWLREHTRLQ